MGDEADGDARPVVLRVGVLGLGIMGGAMARRIVAAGFPLVVGDRSRGPVDELVAAGAAVVGAPAEMARVVDVLIVNVPDTPDLLALVDGAEGIEAGGHPGLVVIAMGTHAPA